MRGKRKPHGKGNKGCATPKAQCLTLEEDEETRCTSLPTHGSPPERCKVHHRQYCLMTQSYKEASEKVDEILGHSIIPSKADIMGYTDYCSALDNARWLKKYIEAIRVEKIGREIHHRRFFLKSDDGHKIRLKVLSKQMVAAVESLDVIQAKAFDIYIADNPGYEWIKEFQDSPVDNESNTDLNDRPLTEASMSSQNRKGRPKHSPPACHEDYLIDIEIRAEKTRMLHTFEPLLDAEWFTRHLTKDQSQEQDIDIVRLGSIATNTLLQFTRRILFYDPVLFIKALNKVSFRDLILDHDFSVEDMRRIARLFQKRLEIGLLWWKDAILEAISMSSAAGTANNAANVGNPKDRIFLVGGWVFNRRHKSTMTNEHWWHIIKALEPPANIENRFMRICNNFDDLHSFLSFGALGMVPPPTFCTKPDQEGRTSHASRNHLSLCGVIVADMVSPRLGLSGPIPSVRPATRRGYITWAEVESRAYIFGAIRLEPDQFTKAFLDELRARPGLFLVVTRSETDPGRKLEMFGGSPNHTHSQFRARTFEAPPTRVDARPRGRGEWTVHRSAVDVLYGTAPSEGYLTALNGPASSGWFFHFKTFPVKYFVILDGIPNRHVNDLARNVAWAALCAHKLVEGEYGLKKYHNASDVLFQRHASERLAWMPACHGTWCVTKMGD